MLQKHKPQEENDMDYLSKKNELKSLKSELKCAYDGIKPDVLRDRVKEL